MTTNPVMQKFLYLIYLVVGGLICSCANMSTLQTARAIPVNKQRIVLGGGLVSFPDLKFDSSGKTTTTHAASLPYFEVGGRFGVASGLEAGGKLTLPGTLAGDVKYQFIDSKSFASAAGLGLSYIAISASPDSSSGIDARALDVTIPFYFSVDVSPVFAIYTAPKYIFRQILSPGSHSYQLGGLTAGLRFGNDVGLFIEGSLMKYLSTSANNAYQVSVAFFFGDAPSVPDEKEPFKSNPGDSAPVDGRKESNSVLE